MAVGVGLGLADFPFSDEKAFWRWVDLCEEGGIDSLWQTDRLISTVPHLECMSVMAALAGRTRRIKFGMNVASAGLREPVLLAKQCATIDYLSGGRLLPAFGVGSPIAPDWAAMGLTAQGSGAVADEALDIIAGLWRETSFSYAGKHFTISEASIAPRPLQKDLPMWIGGSSKVAIRRTARIGTGWQAGSELPEEVGPVVAAIRQAAAAQGRRIDEDHYGTGFHFRFGGWEDGDLPKRMAAFAKRTKRDPRRHFAVGDASAIVARIEEFVAAGISKFVLRPTGTGDQEIIEQTRRLIGEVLPEVERIDARARAM
ncbi:MAG: LLM class flavin-dependent oxidoreductase [Alphaproteobacteria bacterium]